jgi:hypothetical protein
MRKLKLYSLIIFIVIRIICPLKGQMISAGFGVTFFVEKEKVKLHPDVRGKGIKASDTYFHQFTYSHFLNNNFTISSTYSKFPVSTVFKFNNGEDEGAYGWPAGTIITRYDFGLGWIALKKSKFILQPYINLGLQFSKPRDVGIIGTIPLDLLPTGFEQLESVEAEAFGNTQIVPILGLKLGYAFWNRLELFLDIRQVWGFTTVQEIKVEYAFNGIKQPQAINYSDGTGRFWALGLGYRIVKPKAK